MIALVVVVIHEGFDVSFKIAGQEVVLKQDAVFQGLMPALYLALSLWMIRRATRMLHAFSLQTLSEVTAYATGSVVVRQQWFVNYLNLITVGRLKGQDERFSHVFNPHIGAEFLRDDVIALIVSDRNEIELAPSQNLEIGEVSLPKLVDRRGFVFELTGGFHDDEGWTGNQVMRLQHMVHGSL